METMEFLKSKFASGTQLPKQCIQDDVANYEMLAWFAVHFTATQTYATRSFVAQNNIR